MGSGHVTSGEKQAGSCITSWGVSVEDLAAVLSGHSHLHSHRMKGTYKDNVLSLNPYIHTAHALGLINVEPKKDVGEYVMKIEKVYLFQVFKMNTNLTWAIALDRQSI